MKKMMMLCMLFAAAVFAQNNDFVEEAASGGKMEVKLGNMAITKGNAQEVKDFGKMMVEDHSKANEELMQIAQSEGIEISQDLLPKHQSHVDNLNGFEGEEFDKEYMLLMVEDHKEDIEKFEEAAKNNPSPKVQEWAAKNVPVLQGHLAEAENINNSISGTEGTNGTDEMDMENPAEEQDDTDDQGNDEQ